MIKDGWALHGMDKKNWQVEFIMTTGLRITTSKIEISFVQWRKQRDNQNLFASFQFTDVIFQGRKRALNSWYIFDDDIVGSGKVIEHVIVCPGTGDGNTGQEANKGTTKGTNPFGGRDSSGIRAYGSSASNATNGSDHVHSLCTLTQNELVGYIFSSGLPITPVSPQHSLQPDPNTRKRYPISWLMLKWNHAWICQFIEMRVKSIKYYTLHMKLFARVVLFKLFTPCQG